MDMKELRELGKQKFGKACRMCPICDGRACAGEIPGAGGVGTGQAFRNNISALADVKLRQRIIHNVHTPSTTFTLWGKMLTMPILAAPIGGIAFNWNNYISEENYANAVITGCKNVGSLGMVGDGKLPEIYQGGLRCIEGVGGWGIPTIKPRPNEQIITLAKQAEKIGAIAIAIDVDAAALINMTASGQQVGPKTYEELLELKRNIKLPIIIKGIMDVEDAVVCAKAGIDAIVVSNHGGRVLDHTPGTAEVLPKIADRVGNMMTIFVDGGIRTGFDVLKMLALGADAVLLGRPVTQAGAGGAEGIVCLMKHMREELEAAMIMTGCQDLASIDKHIIYEK
jgi:isopentenyl diphosphate isomerase/L-lactate dehydrogenase-like FMN-dependent dehydrogenase